MRANVHGLASGTPGPNPGPAAVRRIVEAVIGWGEREKTRKRIVWSGPVVDELDSAVKPTSLEPTKAPATDGRSCGNRAIGCSALGSNYWAWDGSYPAADAPRGCFIFRQRLREAARSGRERLPAKGF